MSDYIMPSVDFSRQELTILQDLLNEERAHWFNIYEDLIEAGDPVGAEAAHERYFVIKSLRDKVYHLNGRDTLAPGNHEQRWWDQQHDYH